MKKTLITLAAFAMASVASAATLDLTSATLPTTPTTFAGSGDSITLAAGTTLAQKDGTWTFTVGKQTTTYTNTNDLFKHQNGTAGVLTNGTLNFGLDGSLTITPSTGNYNLNGMEMTFNVVLDFVIETDDASLNNKTVVLTRNLVTGTAGAEGQGIWNRTGENNGFTMSVTAQSPFEGTLAQVMSPTISSIEGDYDISITESDAVGTWHIVNEGRSDISVAYIAQYKYVSPSGGGAESVPEPTTATLSLLALAGLAARRRRK